MNQRRFAGQQLGRVDLVLGSDNRLRKTIKGVINALLKLVKVFQNLIRLLGPKCVHILLD